MPTGVEPGVRLQAGGKVRHAYTTAAWSWAADLLEGGIRGLFRRAAWWLSWLREPAVFVAAWWLTARYVGTLIAGLLVLTVETVYVFVWQTRVAREAERRDRLSHARRWHRVRTVDVRWQDDHEPWALNRHGIPVEPKTPGNHLLIGGMTRAGKSGAVNGLLYCIAPWPWVHVVGVDLKDGLELDAWTPRMDVMVETHDQAALLLERIDTFIHERNRWLRGRWRNTEEASQELGQRIPELVVVLDELQELVDGHDKIRGRLESIARRGAASGVWLVSATQHPTAKAIGTTFRGQHGVNVVMRVRSRQDADVMAGQGVLGERQQLDEAGLWVPWEGDISPPKRRDAGRALMVADGITSEVRFLWRDITDLRQRAAETSYVAAQPIITLDTQPASESRLEPSMAWSWAQLNLAVHEWADEHHVPLPSTVDDPRRCPKAALLELMGKEAA